MPQRRKLNVHKQKKDLHGWRDKTFLVDGGFDDIF